MDGYHTDYGFMGLVNGEYMLFDPDFSPWYDYLKAVDRKYTKKELDMKLRMCHRFLANELNAILTAMRTGEVDAID